MLEVGYFAFVTKLASCPPKNLKIEVEFLVQRCVIATDQTQDSCLGGVDPKSTI